MLAKIALSRNKIASDETIQEVSNIVGMLDESEHSFWLPPQCLRRMSLTIFLNNSPLGLSFLRVLLITDKQAIALEVRQ